MKRVTFTRKELGQMIDNHLARVQVLTAGKDPVEAMAFQAGYYEQALKELKVFMDSRYESSY